MNYNIGIVDDDPTKITQLLTYLELGWKDYDGNLIKDKYKDIQLRPQEIKLESNMDSMVQKIYTEKPDALIIDYKLSSQQNISYSGIDLAQAINDKLFDFPIFILTSYQDDLYNRECFDVYQVFDFERYIEDVDERIELNSKIVEQIKKYNKTISAWKQELEDLLPLAGTSLSIDERIIKLDTYIETSIDGESSLSEKLKRDINSNHIQTLIEKIDKVIAEE